jgi:hypothetical protein
VSTAAMMLTVSPIAARAASAGPGWTVASVAQPTNFSAADNALCARVSLTFCDHYIVTVTNVGGGPTSSPVVIADNLPPGLQPLAMNVVSLETGTEVGCNVATTTCVYGEPVPPGNTLKVQLEVKVTGPDGPLANVVTVSGGGATSVATQAPLTMPNAIGGPQAAFGIAGFGFEAHDMNGRLDTQASDHAYGVTSTVNFNTAVTSTSYTGLLVPASVESPKNLAVYLPLGFLGDPTAAARCTALQLLNCPPASRVGTAVVFVENLVTGTVMPPAAGGGLVSAVYNMVPEPGYPAQFAFTYQGTAIPLYASLVHTPAGYALRVATPGLPTTLHIEGAALTFFGDPQVADGNPSASQAFLTNPGDCSAGPLAARVQADSWPHPGQWVTAESVTYPRINGCNLLQFEPTIEMQPEVTQAEEPSGYRIGIKIPQSPPHFPVLATPQLKNVAVTLPEGMTISPGGGEGLTGCPATGPHGIDMPTGGSTPTDVGAGAKGERGEEIGQDGMTHLVAGHCPQSSQIGTVEIRTPVLASPLEGRVYVAQPRCGGAGRPECTSADATNGNLFGLYLEAEGSGAVVKLAGSASVDPGTGRLTARFLENPQVPVSEVNVQLKGGARAPLANPRQCGAAVTSGDLAPWSSPITPDAIVASSFPVDWDGQGGVCPATLPFAPTIGAGVTNPRAGGFSPFTFTLTRGDRQQDLARLQVKTPAGLLGMLSRVALCAEPRAAQGTCEEASQIGTTWVAAGSGSHPLWVSGRVYLTGPYAGAPFGLSIVVPAVAGPFNLGNVVVRSRIDVDPNTGQITITSDPLPQFRDGVPLRIQTLNVTVGREGFMFNPTNCEQKQVTATIEAEQGAAESVSTPFVVEGCKSLPFHPTFKVSTQAKTSKAKGASLTVEVSERPGEANIRKVDLQLPVALPARLTTLQKACTAAQFEANPAGCPAASVIGTAKAVTPVLNVPLVGPAYLVSHGGAAFPDVEFVLQADERGGEVQIVLDGKTQIKKGVTYSRFETVPDAPISSFETVLPQGPHSALGTNIPAKAKGSLCGQRLVVPTTLTGQNGVVVKQSTKVAVTGCAKGKPKRGKKAGSARRSADRKRGK